MDLHSLSSLPEPFQNPLLEGESAWGPRPLSRLKAAQGAEFLADSVLSRRLFSEPAAAPDALGSVNKFLKIHSEVLFQVLKAYKPPMIGPLKVWGSLLDRKFAHTSGL